MNESEDEETDGDGYSCMRLPSLIPQLKSILDQYPDNGQILKELVQNAEDARATEVHIIYDARDCNAQLQISEKGKNRHLRALKGPGLCVYNNAEFSKADWVGIRSIQNSIKEEDRLTVGRFGLGFKSVFHLSDWPCVLSGKHILFIDPHQSVNKVCLMKKLSNLDPTSQQACMEVFSDTFNFSPAVFSEGSFHGTLFWFPLRRTSSQLSDNIYNQHKVEDLFCTFQAEAKMTLLFLKHVESIHLKRKDQFLGIQSVFSVRIASKCLKDVHGKREIFLSKIKDIGADLPVESIQSDQHLFIEIMDISLGNSTEEWIVTNFYKGGHVSETFFNLCHDTDLSYSPYVGIATPLRQDDNFQGHIFCFLPLPLEVRNQSGLPVHINGFFALSQNRAYVKWPTTDQEKNHCHIDKSIQWNKCLVTEVLPQVYVHIVQKHIEYSQSMGNSPQEVQLVYRSFPVPSIVSENWKLILQPFYEQLWQLPVLYTSNQQGMWHCLHDSVLAVYSDEVPLKVQKTITETYRRYNQNIVELPNELLVTVKMYSSKPVEYVECQTLCNLLRSNNTYKTFSRQDRLNLLAFILEFDANCLHGLELLPVADGSFVTFPTSVVFCPGNAQLFPGLERKIIADDLDQGVHSKLGQMATNGQHKLLQLTKAVFHDLLKESLELNFPGEKKVLQCSSHSLGKAWMEKVWMFVHEHYDDMQSVFNLLPVLPQFQDPDCIILHQLTEVFIGQKLHQMNPLPAELAKALKIMGIVVLPEVPTFISPAVDLGLVHEPSCSGVIRALSQICQAGKAEKAIYSFNESASVTEKKCVIQYLQHAAGIPDQAKNVLQCFNLFGRTCSNTAKQTNDLDASIRNICHIAPDTSLPVAYPDVYLECSEPMARRLAKSLNAVELTLDDVILNILDIIGKTNQTQYNTDEIQSFMLFLLQNNKVQLNEKIKEKAKLVKFLSPLNGDVPRAADEVFDPRLAVLKTLFVEEDRFPNGRFQDPQLLDTMYLLGLKQNIHVTSEDICQSAKIVEKMLMSGLKKEAITKGYGILKFLGSHLDSLSVEHLKPILSIRWFPVLQSRPTNYPSSVTLYGEYTDCVLGRPDEMTSLQHLLLIGSTCLVAAKNVSHKIADIFSWNKSPSLDKVADHILNTVQANTEDQYDKIITTMNALFKHLSNIGSLPQSVYEKLRVARLVWIESESAFQKPNILWINTSEHDIDLHPFRYSLPKHLSGMSELFAKLGSTLDQSPDMLLDVLMEIKKKHDEIRVSEIDNNKDLALVLQILNVIKTKKNLERERILVPVHMTNRQLKLMTVEKCTYCNAQWLREIPLHEDEHEGDDAIWYVHEDVSESTAIELGVCSLTNRVMEETEEFDMNYGQKEPLTTRLNNLLKEYKDGFSVPKEIIQNADDAGASEVLFLYDERENLKARSFLIKESMEQLQGPALWAFNDAKFEKCDFENITKLSGATKEDDTRKIGKFGLGFNSIYNLTDVPSFISGNTVVIFDPHTSYLGKPGMKANLSTHKNQMMVKKMKGQFQPFEGVFGCHLENQGECDNECCPGTLFRFPLRTMDQASKSDISKLHYSTDEMKQFINVFFSGAGNLLLFLQSVKRVKFYHLPKGSEDATKPHFILEVRRNDIERSVEINEPILSYMSRKCHDEWNTSLHSFCINEKIDINITVSQNANKLFDIQLTSSETNWIIAWANGQKESAVFAKSNKIKGLLPLAAAAVLYKKEPGNVRLLPLKECPSGFYSEGHLFCFLPLPISFPLPMHVNGTFALTHDRRQLCVKTEDDKSSSEAEWNEALMSDAVCLSIVKVIEELQQMDVQESETSYRLWPKNMDKYLTLQKSFYQLALTTEHKLFTKNRKWATFENSVFLDPLLRFDKNIGTAAFEALTAFQNEGLVVDLPEELIKGLSSESQELYMSKMLTTSAFFEMVIFKNINDPYWQKIDRDQFIIYALLQNDDQINMLIKETPCIPTKPSRTLKQPQGLIHPEGKASRLFCENDECFPIGDLDGFNISTGHSGLNSGFCTFRVLKALEVLGMVKDNLTWNDILRRIQSIQVLNGSNTKMANERCQNILSYLCHETKNENEVISKRYKTCPDDIKQQITTENFLPVLSKPSNWLLPWKADQSENMLANPQVLFFKGTVHLVGSVELLLDETGMWISSIKDMLTWLGIRKKQQVPVSSVIHQLLQLSTSESILDCKEMKEYTVYSVSQSIYAFLNEACSEIPEEQNGNFNGISNCTVIAQELKDKKVMWHNDRFVCAKQLVMKLNYHLEPYLYEVEEILKRYQAFLKVLDISQSVSIDDLRKILDGIAKIHEHDAVTGNDLTCIKNAATLMVDLMKEKENESSDGNEHDTLLIKLPDREGYLYPASDLCMDDYEITEDGSLNILHPDISPSVAKMLGVKPKRVTHLQSFMDSDFRPFGQHEELTRRIKRILLGYPLDSAIMKELLQNADDAEATEIMFIKDFNTHPSERVFGDAWSELQGPALCVYNDSCFTDDDFKGIENLGLGSKCENPVKIGQYGVGFNSVYHLTDVPCFLTVGPDTKETLCILDPNVQYIEIATKNRPGAKLLVKESLRTAYQDVFSGFPTLQVNMKNKGTLFRLPLRTSTMADKSLISYDVVDPKCIESLLNDFKKDMFKSLLFLHHVKKISIASIANDGTMEVEYVVQTEMNDKDKAKKTGFVEHLNTQAENVADFSSGIGVNDMSPLEIQLQLDITDSMNRKEKWLVVHRAGFAIDHPVPEVLSSAWAKAEIHQLPQGGIAVNLEPELKPSVKNAFCMLPLPIETGLPVHVNGHFALDHEDRRNLWDRNNDYMTVWNKHIVTALLVPAYCSAMNAMKAKHYSYCGGTEKMSPAHAESVIQKYNGLFPNLKTSKNEPWKSLVVALYHEIINRRLSLFITKQKGRGINNDMVKLESIPAAVDNGFPGHFPCECDQDVDEHMKTILTDLGLRLIESTKEMCEIGDEPGLNDKVLFTTPDNVIGFLKSYTIKQLHGRCSIDSLPEKVEKTPLKDAESVKCLIKFCQKGDNFWDEIEGMPLLLTESGNLDAFTQQNPIIVTNYNDLVHGSKKNLMMKSVVDLFETKVNNIPQLMELDIQLFAELLPETLDKSYFHSGKPVLCGETSNDPSIKWIKQLWNFLSEQVNCTPAIAENPPEEHMDDMLQDQMDSTISEHLVSSLQEQAEGLTSQQVERKPLDQSENRKHILELVKQLFADWSLLPVTWNREVIESTESSSDTMNYLFPIKDARKVLHCVDMRNEKLNKALCGIVTVPKLDCTRLDSTESSPLPCSLVTDSSNPRQLLELLVCYQYKETFCKQFGLVLLKHFSENVATFTEFVDADVCQEMLRKLPFFKKIDNSHSSIEEHENVVFVKKHEYIPVHGIVDWCSESNIVLFKEESGLSELYQFLKLTPVDSVELYASFLLPKFDLFPSEAKIHHLKYLRYPVLSKGLDYNDDQKQLIQILKGVKFIETEDGTLHKASRFYSKNEPVFLAMCDKSDFPPYQFDEKEWHEFLVLAGMINEVSEELFVGFANEVETKGYTEITKKVAEQSRVLLQHISYVLGNNFLSLFSRIKTIKFIVPLDISKQTNGVQMLRICPQFQCETKLTAFEGSISKSSVYITWSTCPILCDYASSICERYSTSNLKYQWNEKPPIESVIKHMQNVCSFMEEGDTLCLQDADMKIFVGKVMVKLYQYLNTTALSTSDIAQLKPFTTVFLPDENSFVKGEDVITEPKQNQLIKGYLYKAPVIYGQYFDVIHKLGASKIVTVNHYALILDKIFAITNSRRLNSREQKTVKKVVEQLFYCLEKKESRELHTEHLYLPNTDNVLSVSSTLVMSDNTFLRERVTSLNFPFLLDFKKNGIKIRDPVKAVKSLPQKYQPKLLTEIVEEKISSENESFLSARYMNILKSDSFVTGLIRLISHARKQKDRYFTEDDAGTIEQKLSSLEVFEVHNLTTALFYQNDFINGSKMSIPCFTETKDDTRGKHVSVYLDAAASDDEKVDELAYAVNSITGDELGALVLCVRKMILCERSEISHFLDRQRIKVYTYEISQRASLWPLPPGTPIPECFHWMLVNGFNFLDIGAYVGMELYDSLSDDDPANDCDSVCPHDVPRYCCAVVKERKKHKTSPILCEYIVHIGHGREELIAANRLFKLHQPVDSISCDATPIQYTGNAGDSLPVILKKIRTTLNECYPQLDVVQRRKVRNRLYLRWHPDKNHDQQQLCKSVCQYINLCVKKLDTGESIDAITVDQLSRDDPQHDKWSDALNKRASDHKHYKQKALQKGTLYLNTEFYDGRGDHQEAKRWMRQAETDHTTALEHSTFNWICFKYYQAAKEAVTALHYGTVGKPRNINIHSLEMLAKRIDDPRLMPLILELQNIIKDDLRLLYPDDLAFPHIPSEVYTEEDAQQACEVTGRIILFVKQKLQIPIH